MSKRETVCVCVTLTETEEKMPSRSARWAASSPSDGSDSPSSVPLLPLLSLEPPHKQSLFMLPHPLPLCSFSPPFWSVYPVSSWSVRIRIWSKWPKLEWELKPLSYFSGLWLFLSTFWGVTSRNCDENDKFWRKNHVTEVWFISKRGNRKEERRKNCGASNTCFPRLHHCSIVDVPSSVLICISVEVSQKTIPYTLSACEMITQGRAFLCQVWTHRTSFSRACGRSVCVCIAQLSGQWPVLSGTGLGQRVLLWPPLVNNSPFHSVCNLQTGSVKRTNRCRLSSMQQTLFLLSKLPTQLSTIIIHYGNTVTAT